MMASESRGNGGRWNEYSMARQRGNISEWNLENSNQTRKDERRCCGVKSPCRRRWIPWGSMIALVITWSGLFLFCTKMYFGLLDMETLAGGFFKQAVFYLKLLREGVLVLGIATGSLTGGMVVVAFFSTLHYDRSYHAGVSCCLCNLIGSRLLCGLLWIAAYVFNVLWLAILIAIVLATSAYFCFLPICLPQAGLPNQMCFNFTVIASAMSSGSMDGPNSVSLILCGGAIDKFCKLTKAIVPWYWGAFAGCLAVLLGLSCFNGCLAANFAHVKHATRYRKIRRRTKGSVQWTNDWRIKSLATGSTVSIIGGYGGNDRRRNSSGLFPRGRSDSDAGRTESTYYSESECESYVGTHRGPGEPRQRITSTGSIIVQKRTKDRVFPKNFSSSSPNATQSSSNIDRERSVYEVEQRF